MQPFIGNVFLALFWAAMTETFTPANVMVGFVLGYTILWFTQPLVGDSNYFRKIPQIIGFIAFFIIELVFASFRVAYFVMMPVSRMRPAVVAIPLDAKTDTEILLLATVITLTPGSVSLDVSEDRKVLYLHAMFVDDPALLREEIKSGFERRVLEVLR